MAASQLKKARIFFEQADVVSDEVKPILCYHGTAAILDFICSNIVRRKRRGRPGHRLNVVMGSDGWDFDKNWPRTKCHVVMSKSGDFPFYVDVLTVGGWPSFFSGFRLHGDRINTPWEARENPDPLLSNKPSLDLLCNFDRSRYLADSPDVVNWLQGTNLEMVWKVTALLMDFVVVFVAASLARYYAPAWSRIIEGAKSPIYNDIRAAYRSLSEGLPLFFEDEYPFQYSYGTRIGP